MIDNRIAATLIGRFSEMKLENKRKSNLNSQVQRELMNCYIVYFTYCEYISFDLVYDKIAR